MIEKKNTSTSKTINILRICVKSAWSGGVKIWEGEEKKESVGGTG